MSKAEKVCGVYVWTHRESGKKYVGSSFDCYGRKLGHLRDVMNGKGSHFHRQMRENGVTYIWSEDMIASASKRVKEFQDRPENVAAFSKRMRAFWARPGVKEANAARMKEFWSYPENRAAQAERAVEFQIRPESRKAASARMTAYWGRPENRAAQAKRRRKAVNQLSLSGTLIATYASADAAANAVGVPRSTFGHAILRGRPIAGFRWALAA